MKHRNKNTLPKIITAEWIVIGFLLIALLGPLCVKRNARIQNSRDADGVIYVQETSRRELTAPDAPVGQIEEYTFGIDQQISHDTYFAFYIVHQYVEVYLDGESVYRLMPSGEDADGETIGCRWVMLPLYREDAGKELRVEITPVYESVCNREIEFLMGSELDIFTEQLMMDMLQLIVSIAAIFIGLIFIGISGYSIYRYRDGEKLVSLGISSFLVGIWRLADTRTISFFASDRSAFLFYLSVTAMMLAIVPMLKTVTAQFVSYKQNILRGYCIAALLCSMVQLMLQLVGGPALRETLPITHIVIAAGALLLVVSIVFRKLKCPKERNSSGIIGLSLLFVTGIFLDMVLYYINGTSRGLVFTLCAFLLAVVFIGIRSIVNFSHSEQLLRKNEQLLAESERKLTQSRVTAMNGQIRAHFIFNILNAISGMCKYDPEKADETIIRFSRFLRTNIGILENDSLAPFNNALEHLEDYIVLEQIRFGNKIRFQKEIQVKQFLFPSLILQPIVENSIKHGLIPKTEGGTILLRTWKEQEKIYVCIRDDGVGFDTESDIGEDSVGLKNVRFRLEHIMDGRLDIKSIPGEGTEVTLIIPFMEVS